MRLCAAALLAAHLVVGCASSPRPDPSPTVVFAASNDELRPDGSPGDSALLRLGSGAKGSPPATEFPVALARTRLGEETTLTLSSGGEALEREIYEMSPTSFRVIEAGDNAFVPGIDLVRYPARSGESWTWSGKVVYAGTSHPAQAKVDLLQEGDTLRSDVRLLVAIDPTMPQLERRLGFWFRRGRGVTRRAFGDVSFRRPLGEPWRP